MASQITIQLLTETQEGTIGNDWKYALEAKIFSGRILGEGTVKVPKHTLESGERREPPGPPEPLVLPAGEPGGKIRVELWLAAEEVDLIQNDKGDVKTTVKLSCPASGGRPVIEERELSVGITEQPAGIGTAIFKLAYRMTVESD